RRRDARLGDKYVEKYEDVEQIARDMRDRGYRGAENHDRKETVALLLCAECSSGGRKGEYLSPFIDFIDYKRWVKTQRNKKIPFRLGTVGEPDYSLAIDSTKEYDEIMKTDEKIRGMDNVIVQIGVL